MKIWVVKIGTNAIIDDDGNFDVRVAKNIACNIAFLRSQNIFTVLVSSGAVGSARSRIDFCGFGKMSRIEATQIKSAIGQPILMQKYAEIFEKTGLVVAQGLLTRLDFATRSRHLAVKNILEKMLGLGIVPILNENDFLTPEELDFSDNDQLASFVSGLLSAEKLILLSNIDGLFTAHPKNPNARKIDEITEITPETESFLSSEKSENGTGGIFSKISAAKLIGKLGIEMILANSRTENILQKIFSEKGIGTRFLPARDKKASGKRVFLASGAEEFGKITLDCPLENFLKTKKEGISLLAVGIREVSGNFQKGDPIGVFSESGEKIGAGIARLCAEEMREKKGEKGEIFVHADELFLL